MTDVRDVVAGGKKVVTPTARGRRALERTAAKLLDRVEAAAARFEEVRGVLIGGSFAKGTWLPGDVDIDIFVKIASGVDEEKFESMGLDIGRRAARGLPHGKKYAQHPYTEAVVDGVKVNIVPCYDVKPGQWKSAADRSPYHVDFVKKNLNASKKQQVRLLKRFMKVVGVYGAEIEKEGFSGYATEVLIYLHGGFIGALRYFATLKTSDSAQFLLRDPIDENRELSRAISRRNVARMTLASRAFLERPEPKFFTRIEPVVRERMRDRLYAVVFDHSKLSEDTLWGELKRSTRQIVKYIEERGFVISRAMPSSNNVDKSAIILLPEVDALSYLEERLGPDVGLSSETERFIARNLGKAELLWVGDDGRVHMLHKRVHTEMRTLLEEILGKEISRVGASSDIARSIKKTGRLLRGVDLQRESNSETWLRDGVRAILTDSVH